MKVKENTSLFHMFANPYARIDGNQLVDCYYASQHFLRILYIFVINSFQPFSFVYLLPNNTFLLFLVTYPCLKASSLLHKNGNVYMGMTVRLGFYYSSFILFHPLLLKTLWMVTKKRNNLSVPLR